MLFRLRSLRSLRQAKAFIYSLIKIFCFPLAEVKEIFKKYHIERIQMYHVLTGTGSTSLQFIIISDPNSDIPESNLRDVIFEIIVATQIFKRFDASHAFWDDFKAQKQSRKKNWVIVKQSMLIIRAMSL